jgi:hypothetical protein
MFVEDPKSVDPTQQNLFLAGGNIGKCNNFIIPAGKSNILLDPNCTDKVRLG